MEHHRKGIDLYLEESRESEVKRVSLASDLKYYELLKQTVSVGEEIQDYSYDGNSESLTAFLSKSTSFFAVSLERNVQTDYLVEEAEKYELKASILRKHLQRTLREIREGIQGQFKQAYSELERWSKSQDSKKIRQIRKEIDRLALVYKKFQTTLGDIKDIRKYLERCSPEARNALDEQIRGLKGIYDHPLDLSFLRQEQERYFSKGFFGRKKGILRKCEEIGYYEGFLEAQQIENDLGYLINNQGLINQSVSRIKKGIDSISKKTQDLDALVFNLETAEATVQKVQEATSEIASLKKQRPLSCERYLSGFFYEMDSFVQEADLKIKGSKQKAYERFSLELARVKANPTEHEVRQVLRLGDYLARIYNIEPELRELQELRNDLIRQDAKTTYGVMGLSGFLETEKPPERIEFHKARLIWSSTKRVVDKLKEISKLFRDFKPETQNELDYVSSFHQVVKEDSRKGYLAECIDYKGLPEDSVQTLLQNLNSSARRYIPVCVGVAF